VICCCSAACSISAIASWAFSLLRAGSPERLCPERNIRANELDQYVFEQVRQALLDPQQLLAAERALLAGAPDENELVAAQLKRLDSAIDAKERERARRVGSAGGAHAARL
jgi:hypothetical protein